MQPTFGLHWSRAVTKRFVRIALCTRLVAVPSVLLGRLVKPIDGGGLPGLQQLLSGPAFWRLGMCPVLEN